MTKPPAPFLRVALGAPRVHVANCAANAEEIIALMREAEQRQAELLLLPALCLTGATCGDLFRQPALLAAAERALRTVAAATGEIVVVCGLPYAIGDALYACSAVLHQGEVQALVPKATLSPAETRWFAPGLGLETSLEADGALADALVTSCLRFDLGDIPCGLGDETALVRLYPAAEATFLGAPESRRQTLAQRAQAPAAALLYANAGFGESTTDVVYDGYTAAFEPGLTVAEGPRLARTSGLCLADLDLDRLRYQRFQQPSATEPPRAALRLPRTASGLPEKLCRPLTPAPWLAPYPDPDAACEEILLLQAQALLTRLRHTGIEKLVLGISGGLDSTLALLAAAHAFKLDGRAAADIHALTMPGPGTTGRTKQNAIGLVRALGGTLREIPIGESVALHLKEIGHEGDADVTFENAQARERTQILMDYANQIGGLVLGTGDLSEIALGWCTYNGDQMSMYGLNAGLPKTLIPALIRRAGALLLPAAHWPLLEDVIETPISPELLPAVQGQIAQRTEALLGDYALHDFFLYHTLADGTPPRTLLYLAQQAFSERYEAAYILATLRTFYRRFFSQQFKRSCLPDGPQVLPYSLSPRGGWAMPSDMAATAWLAELEA